MRSEINSRSNSASAAKMPKTSFPAGVVVSIAAPVAGKDLESYSACREVVDGVDELAQVAAKPVQLPDHERVTFSQSL